MHWRQACELVSIFHLESKFSPHAISTCAGCLVNPLRPRPPPQSFEQSPEDLGGRSVSARGMFDLSKSPMGSEMVRTMTSATIYYPVDQAGGCQRTSSCRSWRSVRGIEDPSVRWHLGGNSWLRMAWSQHPWNQQSFRSTPARGGPCWMPLKRSATKTHGMARL